MRTDTQNILNKIVPISIDIETASTEKNAVILSIGVYNIRTGDTAYIKIHPNNSLNCTRHTSKATMAWWNNKASQEAKAEAFSGTVPLDNALRRLKEWLTAQGNYNDIHMFANPSDFDCVIIEDAVKQAKGTGIDLKLGWRPTNVHSFKTITLNHWGVVKAEHVAETAERLGVAVNDHAHTALEDAIYQGKIIGYLMPELTHKQ